MIRSFKRFIKKYSGMTIFEEKVESIIRNIPNPQIQLRQLSLYYRQLLYQNQPLPKLSETGFRVYSQIDEDGVLNYIFSLIGTTNKVCLDIAFASPYGSNTTNLILNDGWNGILICSKNEEVERTNNFFISHKDTFVYPPKIYQQWITVENVNETVLKGLEDLQIRKEEIDFFSLDLDGVDYWIWKALKVVEPRLVCIEYLNFMGDRCVTIPYKSDFNRFDIHPDYFGATLPAFVKLAKEKGYRLVGSNRYGYNAFFIKNGIAEKILPEIAYQECLKHPQAIEGFKNRYPAVKDLDWVEI